LGTEKKEVRRKEQVWAEFRFSVIGGLLASPPTVKGELVRQVLAAPYYEGAIHVIMANDRALVLFGETL